MVLIGPCLLGKLIGQGKKVHARDPDAGRGDDSSLRHILWLFRRGASIQIMYGGVVISLYIIRNTC